MKKGLVILFVVLLAAGPLTAAGCGTKGSSEGEDTEVISLDENVKEGIVGTFKQNTGGGKYVILKKDNSFEGDAWGSVRKGTYVVEDTGEHSRVILTFADGGTIETWPIGISMGQVFAVTSPEAAQYNKEQQH